MDENSLQELLGTAELDQQKAGLRSFARILGAYCCALEREGFNRQEALILVRAYQAEIMETNRRREA